MPGVSGRHTFAFVDLAGFTALTEIHGDDVAVELVVEFQAVLEELVVPFGSVVKRLGDGAMCVFPGPECALRALGPLAERLEPRVGLLARSGVHHGDAREVQGDYVGTAVNVASRLVALALPGHGVGTTEIAAEARRIGRTPWPIGQFDLRHIRGPVEVWDLGLNSPSERTIDPICHMPIDPPLEVGVPLATGWVWFCSDLCRSIFLESTERES